MNRISSVRDIQVFPVGAGKTSPEIEKYIRYFPVIIGGVSTVNASSAIIISYRVPIGFVFEMTALSLEADSILSNERVTFGVVVDGAIQPDAANITLEQWNIAKENTMYNIVLLGGQYLEISVATADAVNRRVVGMMNGRRMAIL